MEDLEILVRELLHPDVEDMGMPYVGSYLYKFYDQGRSEFFTKPCVRFSVKSALNDPFEFSKRWKTFLSQETMGKLETYFRKALIKKLSDPEYLADQMLRRVTVPKSISIEEFRRKIVLALARPDGVETVRAAVSEVEKKIPFLLEGLRSQWPTAMEEFIATTGVFSTTETIDNSRLWGLYAGSGRGFAVELNAKHPFFLVDGLQKSVFRGVKYTDSWIEDLFVNPYYLFLVKDQEWAFEKEWRALKAIEGCDIILEPDIHLWNLPVGSISSVIFGYNCGVSFIDSSISALQKFDDSVIYKKAAISERQIIAVEI